MLKFSIQIIRYINNLLQIFINLYMHKQQKTTNQLQHLPQKLWHKIVRPDYVIDGCIFQLSGNQVTHLIQAQQSKHLINILDQKQKKLINEAIAKSLNKKLYPKINGRTPKDLPLINRQIHKIQDFIHILHSSQYILQGLHKNHSAEVILRNFMPELTLNNKIYQIFVRGGYTLAIGQKFCDHVQEQPSQQQFAKIIDIVQQIIPGITLMCPKGEGHQLNSFMVSLYLNNNIAKITSILAYPPYPREQQHHIFTEQQLEKYYNEIEKQELHKSEQQKYEMNERVIPLIRTILKKQEIKHYDMGEYLMGNQINDGQKLNEWKEFIKEADSKMKD